MKYSMFGSNTLRVSTSSFLLQMPMMVNVGIVFSNRALRRLASPSSFRILGHGVATSMLHNIESTRRVQRACRISEKSCVSRMYDGILGTKGRIK